ncbi:hypothetical protein HCH_02983 [Hahella chejuensis KCTC 2396]|uniref:Uncharacterized protein n=1 Tax=Hahella chejuensis (strain KCTC 2396) TaxID=349521 RepID=Q2SHX2_HAHCH|nr:hypothetical protein [Hahella chejuensis]ABC29752.1 hypothetical protein HCH_02983 [Hahella chejuensis KCTC 2396]
MEKLFACNDRVSPVERKLDITLRVGTYLPLDSKFESGITIRSPLLPKKEIVLKSKRFYKDVKGERLIIEVGCTTVIFLQISPEDKSVHNRIFIQRHDEFIYDTDLALLHQKLYETTKPIKTLVKYEMYVMMGYISTLGIAGLLASAGSSTAYSLAQNQHLVYAYITLTKSLGLELDRMASFAPTFRIVLLNFMVSERRDGLKDTLQRIPRAIINDEAVQGNVVGILMGEYDKAPQKFSGWSVISVVLIQGIVNSFLKFPKALSVEINERYIKIINDLRNLDISNKEQKKQATAKVVELFQNSGISISDRETQLILDEIVVNPNEFLNSLNNIELAFKEFLFRVK